MAEQVGAVLVGVDAHIVSRTPSNAASSTAPISRLPSHEHNTATFKDPHIMLVSDLFDASSILSFFFFFFFFC